MLSHACHCLSVCVLAVRALLWKPRKLGCCYVFRVYTVKVAYQGRWVKVKVTEAKGHTSITKW